MNTTLKLTALLLVAALYGCGSDGGGSGPVADSYVFPAGTTTLTFTAMSTAKLPASISGIDFTLNLPAGMTVTPNGATGAIATTTVTPGMALTGTNLAYGSYSASTRKAYLGMATTSASYRSGEFLRLACTVGTGTSITLADLKTLNNPATLVKAVGYDAATDTTIQLTDKVRVTIGANK